MKYADEESLRPLTELVIGAMIEVHRHLGPGLLEEAYHACLCHEFSLRGIPFETQVEIPILYKGIRLECAYKVDFLIDDVLVIEIKAVKRLEDIFRAQLLTYLKVARKPLGLLVNFHEPRLVSGLERMVNGLPSGRRSEPMEQIDLQE